MDDQVVEAMTDKILGDLPNTYAFTKALSEGLVEEAMKDIPAIILRLVPYTYVRVIVDSDPRFYITVKT